MDFTVRYIAHIDERKRPENFPHSFSTIGTYRVQNPEQLKSIVNSELGSIIQNGGMIVPLDPSQTVDTQKVNIDDRIYVPMHMITYIEADIRPMAAMPNIVDTGIVDANGKAIKEYEMQDGKRMLPS
jgi:hypothetical protein